MTRRRLLRFVLGCVGAVLALASGCGLLQQPCACGESFETDPWTEESYVVGSSHAVAAHCVCSCGDDAIVLEAPSARCAQYEGDCVTSSGEDAEYTCR